MPVHAQATPMVCCGQQLTSMNREHARMSKNAGVCVRVCVARYLLRAHGSRGRASRVVLADEVFQPRIHEVCPWRGRALTSGRFSCRGRSAVFLLCCMEQKA